MTSSGDFSKGSEAPATTKTCGICVNLRKMFTDSEYNDDQGLFDEILKTPCSSHDSLLRFLRDDLGGRQDRSRTERYHMVFNGDKKSIHVGTTADYRFWDLLLASDRIGPQSSGHGRVLDTNWIDLELAKKWERDCIMQHGEKCRNPLGVRIVSPAWLVDVVENCLVPGIEVPGFVALSYRWGPRVDDSFRTNRDLLDVLQEPGSISPDRLGDDMAPIIRHAIGLTLALGERHLWVDALCIVQDDEEHCAEQLRLMGAIYASAKLTIVASDGDAMSGIPGLKGISPPRDLHQTVIPVFENEQAIVRKQVVQSSITGSTSYFHRGWTFQEFHLAKRRLMFAGNQIHWHCACADWHEDAIEAESKLDETHNADVDHAISNVLRGTPDLFALTCVFGEYSQRKLSFPEDALPGISGLLAIMSRIFDGGFLFGLPETCFDAALMWRTPYPQEHVRRKDSGRSNSLGVASLVPSWSWISWKCHFFLQEQTYEGHRGYKTRTIPITQWYTHETPDTTKKRPIISNWFRVRDKFLDSAEQLPDGWTREVHDETTHGKPPEGLGQHVYRHISMPDKHFWLPVPIAAIEGDVKLFSPKQTPYISCMTKRGWFVAMPYPETFISSAGRAFNENIYYIGLLDRNDRYCGLLYLQRRADILHLLDHRAGSVQVELVAICRRRISLSEARWKEKMAEEKGKETIQEETYKDVYGVLWVVWEGVAYRKASGLIEKDAWENHRLEDVHLILG